MHKLLRYYNQNKIKVWGILLAIILGWIMLQVLNNAIKEQNTNENKDQETTSNVVSYHNESESMITGGRVSSAYSDEIGAFINQFFTYCINHEPQNAYNMVSNDTKQQLYQTEELFEKNYYANKFNGNKQFSFQSWSRSDGIFIYQVRIFDNMLATGQTNDNYIVDYVTVTVDAGSYKLNLDSYLGRKQLNVKNEDNNLSVQAVRVDRYLDYEIYTLNIQNKNDVDILLDTKRDTNSCYVVDSLGNKFEALLYENNEEDLEFSSKEMKTIQIKFSDAYREGLNINSINFTDIVISDEYSKNSDVEARSFVIEI